ncbi:MAG: 30S ribosomal protein S5 [Planctomycetota bacterium]|jgi:small subunit ribosomal protein S5|nr:30S ribosomal protein S5 [Planctomycetota bacterium]
MAKENEQSGQSGQTDRRTRGGGGGEGGGKRRGPAAREPRSKLYDEEVIRINRVDKVVSGGRRSSFSSFVVLGNSQGKVGFAQAKAKQVPSSIDKAVRHAEKTVKAYPIVNGTIPHEVEGRFGASRVRLIPARDGTGVIAGKSVRAVLEKLGVHNILTKCYGSTNPVNVVRATIDALEQLKTKEQYQALRGTNL